MRMLQYTFLLSLHIFNLFKICAYALRAPSGKLLMAKKNLENGIPTYSANKCDSNAAYKTTLYAT